MRLSLGACALIMTTLTALNLMCQQATDGYFPYQIPSTAPRHPEWDVLRDSTIAQRLSQPFYYLGKGHQCFVFESKDGKSILKFPFHSQVIPPLWMRPIPLLSELFHARQFQKKHKKLTQDALSYKLAYDSLKEDTGVQYIHLNRTDGTLPIIKAYDKIGVEHALCLDHMEFILQDKAGQLFDTIDRWMSQGRIETAKQGLLDLIGLFERRFALGIEDREYVLDTNYGFLDERAMLIDIGRLRLLEAPLSREAQANLIWGVFSPLSDHLERHYPELALFLHQERVSYLESKSNSQG